MDQSRGRLMPDWWSSPSPEKRFPSQQTETKVPLSERLDGMKRALQEIEKKNPKVVDAMMEVFQKIEGEVLTRVTVSDSRIRALSDKRASQLIKALSSIDTDLGEWS